MNTKKLGLKMLAVVAGAVLLAQVVPARAETVTFKQYASNDFSGGSAYMGTQDSALYGSSTFGDKNFGGGTVISVGKYSSTIVERSVIRFDLSDFAGQYASIDSVTLRLYVSGNYTGSDKSNTLQVYQIASGNKAWVEGTGNNAIETGAVCWNYMAYDPSTPTDWVGGAGLGDPGDGYGTASLAAAITWTSGTSFGTAMDLTFTGTSAELTALINSFTAPGTNAGLLLRAFDETTNSTLLQLYSSNNDGNKAQYTPELIVGYSVPEPATLAMLGLGGVMMSLRRKRNA